MFDPNVNLAEKYNDIELCYKVMGLEFSDPPEKVDKVYHDLLAGYKHQLRSSGPGEIQDAKKNIEQVQELYERITCSLIYRDYAREYEKYRQAKHAEKEQRQHHPPVEKSMLINCPLCGKVMHKGYKTCPSCHKKVYSKFELLMMKVFSTRIMIIAAVLLLVCSAAAVFVFRSELLKFLK